MSVTMICSVIFVGMSHRQHDDGGDDGYDGDDYFCIFSQ